MGVKEGRTGCGRGKGLYGRVLKKHFEREHEDINISKALRANCV